MFIHCFVLPSAPKYLLKGLSRDTSECSGLCYCCVVVGDETGYMPQGPGSHPTVLDRFRAMVCTLWSASPSRSHGDWSIDGRSVKHTAYIYRVPSLRLRFIIPLRHLYAFTYMNIIYFQWRLVIHLTTFLWIEWQVQSACCTENDVTGSCCEPLQGITTVQITIAIT
jgi:hypothetical protein